MRTEKKNSMRIAHYESAHANNRGFYMAEAIMAIFLLGVGLLAALALLSKTLTNNISDRNQVIAVMLAQEGAELVRNLRDNSWAAGGYAFYNNVKFPGNNISVCKIDVATSLDCTLTNTDFSLNLVSNANGTKKYRHVPSGTATIFQRRIAVSYGGSTPAGQRDGNPVSVANAATSATVASIVIWGSSWPTSFSSASLASQCNVGNKCTYAEVNLTNWNK